MQVKANGINVEVEETGGQGPAVMLIMGLGMQLTAWPEELVQALAEARYRVIRHDNRDIGLSRKFDNLKTPNLIMSMIKWRLGMKVRLPYTLKDMAQDALGVLDALGVTKAHVVGVSMGGMIAQRMALAAPERLLSLTSIMSSSGARNLPQARADIARAMMKRPRSGDAAALLEYNTRLLRMIGSPAYPTPEAEIRQRLKAAIERSFDLSGVQRQLLAIGGDAQRAGELSRITTPALVIHGRHDPLIPLPCGEDTARRIPGARLVVIDGMGHDLPPQVIELILPEMLAHFARNNGA